MDMSTPLLLEVAPEIDTNPTSFYRRRGRRGGVGPHPDPRYRLALAMSVHPTNFDPATSLVLVRPIGHSRRHFLDVFLQQRDGQRDGRDRRQFVLSRPGQCRQLATLRCVVDRPASDILRASQGCRGVGISVPIPIPKGIPMGIPIPTAESRAAVGTEFLSTYPPHTHTQGDPHGDPHTHGRVQGCRGDGISIHIFTPYPYPWGSHGNPHTHGRARG